MKIDGVYQLPEEVLSKPSNERFNYIFETGLWARSTGGESVSGAGSTMQNTEIYREQMRHFLSSNNNNKFKFFDAPCGDLNWVTEFFDSVEYIGGDISDKLIEKLSNEYPNLDLRSFDITRDTFPDADIWHCRHCLFHLSLEDIYLALKNFCSSKVPFALITNHFLPDKITFDIPTGSFRFLDLKNFPFYFPEPKLWLFDSNPSDGKMPLASGLWTRENIQNALENYVKNIGQ